MPEISPVEPDKTRVVETVKQLRARQCHIKTNGQVRNAVLGEPVDEGFSSSVAASSWGKPITMKVATFSSADTAASMLSKSRSVFIFFLMNLRVVSEPVWRVRHARHTRCLK